MYLNNKYVNEFRDAINSTDIFCKDEKHRENFNLFCAIMDRIDSAIDYLRSNPERPKTENQLLLFMVHSCLIYDGTNQLRRVLGFEYPFEMSNQASKYFKDVCSSPPLNIPDENIPTDDKFFEYIRSMILAHPFNTDRPKFLNKKEIHYSPYLNVDSTLANLRGNANKIGFTVYSNQEDDLDNVSISFDVLKSYINSRYELFNLATEKIDEIIQNTKNEWEQDKVTPNLSSLETLKDIKEIMNRRHLDIYEIDLVIEYLKFTNIHSSRNYDKVEKFKDMIKSIIPDLITSIEAIKHDETSDILSTILYAEPKIDQKFSHYKLQKIFGLLNDDSSSNEFTYGITMCKEFYNSFANKWVYIDFDNMHHNEIKMLIRISLYLEWDEQLK